MSDARALFDMGLLHEAAEACRVRLAHDVDDRAALHLLGVILLRQGAAAEAVPLLTVAAEDSAGPAVLNDLGEALQAAGLSVEAEARFRTAVALGPQSPAPFYNLACLVLARGDNAEAVGLLRQAIMLAPEFAEAWFALGNALLACNHPAEAEACYRAAIARRPDYVEALNNLGNVLRARQQPDDAAASYRAALVHRPDSAELWLGLGNALLDAGDAESSERSYRMAIATRPDFADAAGNLGNALVAQHRLDEACDAFRISLYLNPDDNDNRYNYALALLLDGRFEDGWRQYEARRGLARMRQEHARRPALPQWHEGMRLEGQRVLLTKEQGFGDFVQFVRYAPVLAARGVVVRVEMPRELRPVFDALSGVTASIDPDDAAPDCDIACPLMSLPRYFGTTLTDIPAAVPYAAAPADRVARWREWLGPRRGRRIGLVCSGRPTHPLDRQRSVPLASLAPLLDVPDCEFFLLQPDVRAGDDAALAVLPGLRWPGPRPGDFGDTAALLAEMDLLVTVDTAVTHLAGAMARPVWLLLPFVPDYRWLLHRRDSPWYPTMTLYRQLSRGDWGTVIAMVRRDLAVWCVT